MKIKNAAVKMLLASAMLAASGAQATTNVALGKSVMANGAFGVGGWGSPAGSAGSVTDGVVPADGTQWDHQSLWWDTRNEGSLNNSIVVDLGDNFTLTSLMLQADNNDEYVIDFDNGGAWVQLWDVAITPNGGGLETHTTGIAPVTTDALRITAKNGDGWYSVSELQAFGDPASDVPEPGVLALLGLGAAAAALVRRRAA